MIAEPLSTTAILSIGTSLKNFGGFIDGRSHAQLAGDLIGGLVDRVLARRASEASLPAVTGVLPGPGISERPSTAAPFPVVYGNPSIGAPVVSKPLLSAIRDAAVGRGPGGGGVLDLPPAGIEEVPTEEPEFAEGIYSELPPFDWEDFDQPDRPVLDYDSEGEEMAIDWGNVLSGTVDILQGQQVGGGVPPAGYATVPALPSAPLPAQVTVDTRTGKVTHCRRRRRRRLLTPTDLSDLAALAAVVGKGDALKLAVAKAVRR